MTKKRGFLFKIALLSISLLLTTTSSISMTIPMIIESFPEISKTTIESLVTIPSFTMIIFILLSGFISKKLGSKKTVMLGLLLSLIGGIAPLFVQNFTIIYVSRFILGAGLGCYNSLAVSLINDFYEGDEKQSLIGFQSATQSLGSSFATFLAGMLANIDWHYAFAIYLIALPVMVLFYLVIPDTKQQEEKQSLNQTVNSQTIFYSMCIFFLLIFAMTTFTKIGSYISEENISNSQFLGTALSLMTLSGFVSGLVYGHIFKLLRKYTPVVGSLVLAVSFILLSNASNIYMVTFHLMCIGFCLSLLIPYIFGKLLETAAQGSETLAVSIGMVGSNLGTFASPYVIYYISTLFNEESSSFALFVSGIGCTILMLIFLVDTFKKNKSVLV